MSELTSAPIPPIDEDDHVRGCAGAPLVLMYGDYACPHCAVAHARLAGLRIRVAFRHFALRAKHPRTVPLAQAAEAAALQGAFWEFHDSLYTDQGRLDDPHLWERARRLGLDVERFDADRRAAAAAERVARDVRGAMRAGVVRHPLWSSPARCTRALRRRPSCAAWHPPPARMSPFGFR